MYVKVDARGEVFCFIYLKKKNYKNKLPSIKIFYFIYGYCVKNIRQFSMDTVVVYFGFVCFGFCICAIHSSFSYNIIDLQCKYFVDIVF